MVLLIKDKSSGLPHEVVKYLKSTGAEQCVWTVTWPGRHIIGQDCEWFNVSMAAWRSIVVIRDNPELSVRELAAKIGLSYNRIWRLVEYYGLPVRREKGERRIKAKESGKSVYFNPNKMGNWMM